MAAPYTTHVLDGDTCWFNARGEQVAHYPDMLLQGLLHRTLDRAEQQGSITETQAAGFEQAMLRAWPMHADDSADQFNARCALVETMRTAGLLA